MFTGLLGKEPWDREDTEKKPFFTDFNLDQCISRINSLTRGYDLHACYYYLPQNAETTEYRRRITGDFRDLSLRQCFAKYASAIEKVKKQEKNSSYSHHAPEQMKWHADALYGYAGAVEELYRELSRREGLSEAMGELVQYLEEYLSADRYQEWKPVVEQVHKGIDGEPVSFVVQKNKVIVEDGEEREPFQERIQRAFRLPQDAGDSRKAKEEPRPLTVFEETMAGRLVGALGQKKALSFLMKIEMDERLLQLAFDVQFYLGFFAFRKFMEDRGYAFCMPETGERLLVENGYDAAMAVGSEEPVVANDFEMRNGEQFFVITGANGGGKTTFARMIGQILYFSRMGLMVPCRRAVIPHFSEILSHFSDEESEKTGRGKLMEELVRLQPMMRNEQENMFVVLNELFTTAATMDAGIMGRRVLKHFVENGCYGIYVTHIQSLAEEGNGIVSMVAELQPDHRTRSYKIQRKPASEGEYEDSLITKYQMTYGQMKKVMADGD